MPGYNGENVTAALGLDGLDEIDETGLPDAGTDEANEGLDLEGQYDLTDPPGGEEEPDDTGDQPQGRKQLVPLGALQEERTKRQNYERELEESRAQQQRMQDRFNEMMMRLQGVQTEKPAEPQEEAIPDFHDDPAGHVAALTRNFEKRMSEMQAFVQQSQGQSAQQTQVQQLAQQATAAEVEFRKTAPDYDQASDYFRERKLAEYEALGLDPAAAVAQLARDCTGLVQMAAQQKRNPAEAMYKLAKALGYTPQTAPKPQQQGQPPAQQQRPAAKAPTSLANVHGAPKAPDEDNGGEMSLAKVANMSDKEFDKFFNDMGKGSVQRPKF